MPTTFPASGRTAELGLADELIDGLASSLLGDALPGVVACALPAAGPNFCAAPHPAQGTAANASAIAASRRLSRIVRH
jgi:hypothetical protein